MCLGRFDHTEHRSVRGGPECGEPPAAQEAAHVAGVERARRRLEDDQPGLAEKTRGRVDLELASEPKPEQNLVTLLVTDRKRMQALVSRVNNCRRGAAAAACWTATNSWQGASVIVHWWRWRSSASIGAKVAGSVAQRRHRRRCGRSNKSEREHCGSRQRILDASMSVEDVLDRVGS